MENNTDKCFGEFKMPFSDAKFDFVKICIYVNSKHYDTCIGFHKGVFVATPLKSHFWFPKEPFS